MTSFTLKPKGDDGEPKKPALNTQEMILLLHYEQVFWETGMLPTEEKVYRAVGIEAKKVRECWENPRFREAVLARGIDIQSENSQKVLDPKQLQIANVMLNIHDKRTVREKLNELGISPQQYAAWKRQPAFSAYMRKRAENLFQGADDIAFTKLVEGVGEGDKDLLKLFFEMRGIHNPRVQVDVNIQGIMVQVVEIISRHVIDPDTLNAIASDMEQLAVGGSNGNR